MTYDSTGNIPPEECESPASDYWDDSLVWDEIAHRYIYRDNADEYYGE